MHSRPTMPIDERNVCQIYGTLRGDFGSGYLIRDELVLTARHVVEHGGQFEVRLRNTTQWLPAAVPLAWSGESRSCDAALLRVPGLRASEEARLGRLAKGASAPCRAIGFPRAQDRDAVRVTEDIEGTVSPLTGEELGRLTIHVSRSVPEAERSGHSPWEGMSGAAVFCDALLVGVLTVDPANFGSDRLEAVPVAAMAAEGGFATAVGVDGRRLAAYEDEPVRAHLESPYDRVPISHAPAFFAERSAPSYALNPRKRVVPFRGRKDDLHRLTEWCAREERLGLAFVAGVGGVGKTRFSAELCTVLESDGWVTGFAGQAAGSGSAAIIEAVDAGVFDQAVSHLLIVVDEAHRREDELAALLLRLAQTPNTPKVRILASARDEPGWWSVDFASRLEPQAEAWTAKVRALRHTLWAVDESPEGRTGAYLEAAEAFAGLEGRAAGPLPVPDLAAEPFDAILFIHLAALTGVTLHAGAAGPQPAGANIEAGSRIGPELLLNFALGREARLWSSAAPGLVGQLGLEVRRRAVAVATMTVAENEEEAAKVLDAVPDLRGDGLSATRHELARWLRDLYPGTGHLRSLRPVVLGDVLVDAVLADLPDLADDLIERGTQTQQRRCLAVLTRIARTHPTARRALAAILEKRFEALWAMAIEVAQEAGEPIGRLLADALASHPMVDAAAIHDRIPDETVALLDLAAVAARRALEQARSLPPGPTRDAAIARLANDLGFRLAALGHHEDALRALEESVAAYRELDEREPGGDRTQLARSLRNKGNRLADLGRTDEALAPITESADIYRAAVAAGDNAMEPALALGLNSLAICLAELGRREDALRASQEAVELYRGLARDRPAEFQPLLARSLSNLSFRLADLRRHADALEVGQEALAIRRTLAADRPDAYVPDLARNLSSLSFRLAALERYREALDAAKEALEIRRVLVDSHPDAFEAELAKSLRSFSNRLVEVGRFKDALDAIDEAVVTYRRLAEKSPKAYLPEVADSLNSLAIARDGVGDLDGALDASGEAVEMYRTLVRERPDVHRPYLARTLSNHSFRLAALERHDEALLASEESRDIRRELAERQPEAFGREFARSLQILARRLARVGRHADAVATAGDAFEAYGSLADPRPRGMAKSLEQKAKSLEALGRIEEARAAADRATELYRRLSEGEDAPILVRLAD